MRHPLLIVAAAAAIAAPLFAAGTRPAADIERDAARKPAAMIAFAGIKPGMMVADFLPGGGYFTRVFAESVGAKGHVTAIIPAASAARNPDAAKAIADLGAPASYGNVDVKAGFDAVPAGSLDVAWTSENYHDLHNALPAEGVLALNKQVLAALKKGGVYVVLDHAAAAGSPADVTKTLHRIEAATVKSELVAAGFAYDGESTAVANPADPRDKAVFDPSIRGKTDQFVYRFKKP